MRAGDMNMTHVDVVNNVCQARKYTVVNDIYMP